MNESITRRRFVASLGRLDRRVESEYLNET
jgi:hypothetical protein